MSLLCKIGIHLCTEYRYNEIERTRYVKIYTCKCREKEKRVIQDRNRG